MFFDPRLSICVERTIQPFNFYTLVLLLRVLGKLAINQGEFLEQQVRVDGAGGGVFAGEAARAEGFKEGGPEN